MLVNILASIQLATSIITAPILPSSLVEKLDATQQNTRDFLIEGITNFQPVITTPDSTLYRMVEEVMAKSGFTYVDDVITLIPCNTQLGSSPIPLLKEAMTPAQALKCYLQRNNIKDGVYAVLAYAFSNQEHILPASAVSIWRRDPPS